uniref:Uncharacterized protein n=1 Tax=Arundo donax TaxID=35708 RepID=A0A0A9GCH7_ARUDO
MDAMPASASVKIKIPFWMKKINFPTGLCCCTWEQGMEQRLASYVLESIGLKSWSAVYLNFSPERKF